MLPGWLRNTRQGILATPDSTYEWRRKGEHVNVLGQPIKGRITFWVRLDGVYLPGGERRRYMSSMMRILPYYPNDPQPAIETDGSGP